MTDLLISEVAKASKVQITTIRYYERRGLIPEPPRSQSGYRKFSLATVERIKFIKRSQDLGFTLSEIKKLLLIREDSKSFDSKEILEFTNQKIREIEAKIENLENMKSLLTELSDQCPGSGNPISNCPIMETLTKGGEFDG